MPLGKKMTLGSEAVRADTVTTGMGNPLGFWWVERLGFLRWGWEVRKGGFHVDAGIERTRKRAISVAKEVLQEANDNAGK